MFASNVLSRRLRLRRLRRSVARFEPKLSAQEGLADFDDMLGELCQWATGMPWVVEKAGTAGETLKLFLVSCNALSCHEPWFAISAFENDLDNGPGIFVVLPDVVADRAAAIGCAAGIEAIGRRRSITAIGLPTSEGEFEALQRLLEVTYAAAFDPSN